MGILYYVVDAANGRAFSLGKGSWWERVLDPTNDGFDDLVPVPCDITGMRSRWRDRLLALGTLAEDIDPAWLERCAVQLWAFCQVAEWRVELKNDAAHYVEEVRVASRYDGHTLTDDDDQPVVDPRAAEQAHWEAIARAPVSTLEFPTGSVFSPPTPTQRKIGESIQRLRDAAAEAGVRVVTDHEIVKSDPDAPTH